MIDFKSKLKLLFFCAFASVASTKENVAQELSGVVLLEEQPLSAIYVERPIIPRTILDKLLDAGFRADRSLKVQIDGQERTFSPEEVARSVAARELTYHLEKMLGSAPPTKLIDSASDVTKPGIVLGRMANQLGGAPDLKTEHGEGFRLVTKDENLLIGSESAIGLRHGVYAFLRRSGIDWIMPDDIGEIIPERDALRIDAIDVTDVPDFAYRRLWYRGYKPRLPEEHARFELWKWRHMGRTVSGPVFDTSGHISQKLIRKFPEVFEADPTMLALVLNEDGELVRKGPQIDTTHPKVVELFIAEIRSTYEENIAKGLWTAQTPAGFGIGPADGLGYSRSPEALSSGSMRTDPVMGAPDQTDLLVLLANKILDDVTKDYPNALVGYYSYAAHADFPRRYTPHPNLAQIFAPISYSRFHAVTDPISKTKSYYRSVVEKWSALSKAQGNPLAFRGYNWNLADNMLPFSKVRIWGEELPYYHAQGFVGLNVEATKQWSVLAPSDYVFMRLAWDATQNWRDLLREFCEKAYGSGAEPMERYWLRLIETQRNAGMEAGSYHAFPLMYDQAWVDLAEADLAEALNLAETKKDRTRIRYAGIGLEFLRLYLDYHKATLDFDFAGAANAYRALQTHWQSAYDENTDLVASEVPGYLDRFLGEFLAEATKFSSPPYEILLRLPDELPTAFDPYVAGDRLGLHQPDVVDERFIRTKTISSTWDAQGLSGLRNGAVWYRWRFELSPEDLGNEVGLFLGGVEDTAHVWLNGEKVGSDGPDFSTPMLFDLTQQINTKGENLLAIQVVRTSQFNENGLGGILRPSFIYSKAKHP